MTTDNLLPICLYVVNKILDRAETDTCYLFP